MMTLLFWREDLFDLCVDWLTFLKLSPEACHSDQAGTQKEHGGGFGCGCNVAVCGADSQLVEFDDGFTSDSSLINDR